MEELALVSLLTQSPEPVLTHHRLLSTDVTERTHPTCAWKQNTGRALTCFLNHSHTHFSQNSVSLKKCHDYSDSVSPIQNDVLLQPGPGAILTTFPLFHSKNSSPFNACFSPMGLKGCFLQCVTLVTPLHRPWLLYTGYLLNLGLILRFY